MVVCKADSTTSWIENLVGVFLRIHMICVVTPEGSLTPIFHITTTELIFKALSVLLITIVLTCQKLDLIIANIK